MEEKKVTITLTKEAARFWLNIAGNVTIRATDADALKTLALTRELVTPLKTFLEQEA